MLPASFACAMDEGRAVMAGIRSAAAQGFLDDAFVARAQAAYRLRIEVEIEAAQVLWAAAAVLRGLGGAIECLDEYRKSSRLDELEAQVA
jgi:hypothetical protein